MNRLDEMPRRERPPRLFPLLLGATAGTVILGILLLLFPIEWHEAQNRFRLWRAGARPVQWEKYRGFELDRCAGATPADCPCLWLVHGLGDSVSTWRRFFLDPKVLSDRPVRILALDLPGHGGSLRRKNIEEYRVSSIAQELDEGIAATKTCSRNVLVGNSLGGWIGSWIAIEDSKRVQAGAPPRYEHLFLLAPAGVKKAEGETSTLFRDNTVEALKEFQRRAYYRPRELPNSTWKRAIERMKDSAVKDVIQAQVADDRLDTHLKSIRVPTTLIWGDADRILSKNVMDVFIAGVPNVRFVTLEKCGHLPQKECPEALFSTIQADVPQSGRPRADAHR